MQDNIEIPDQPLVDRKRKNHMKRAKGDFDAGQRINKVQRKQQMMSARIRDMEEEIDDWY